MYFHIDNKKRKPSLHPLPLPPHLSPISPPSTSRTHLSSHRLLHPHLTFERTVASPFLLSTPPPSLSPLTESKFSVESETSNCLTLSNSKSCSSSVTNDDGSSAETRAHPLSMIAARWNSSCGTMKDLWLVVREGSVADVDLAWALLKKGGGNINARNMFGLTPLHVAI